MCDEVLIAIIMAQGSGRKANRIWNKEGEIVKNLMDEAEIK